MLMVLKDKRNMTLSYKKTLEVNEMIITTIGSSAQRTTDDNPRGYPLILGGTKFEGASFTMAEWYDKNPCDGDAVLHALTRAVQQLDPEERDIMGPISAKMIRNGTTDSSEFLRLAVQNVKETGGRIDFVSIMIEGDRPRFSPMIHTMRENIARLMGMECKYVTILATTSDGLDAYGRGEGIRVTAMVTGEINY